MFEIIEHGLCSKCRSEVYARTYGVENITPKKYPDDWRKRQNAQSDAFDELAEQTKTRVVVVATFWDDYALDDNGEIKDTLCERHLREALDALLEATDA